MDKYNVYIDESGDEGIQKGTEWFILCAVMVKQENDLILSKVIDEIKNMLNIPKEKPFHWKNMRNNHSKKRAIIDLLKKRNFVYTNIIVNTRDMKSTELQGKLLYNYTCRFLLERVSWFIKEQNTRANVIFSNRSSTSYSELEEYINTTKIFGQIKSVFDSYKSVDVWQLKNLQVADICASSMHDAFEKDQFGYIEERYVMELSPKLYRRKGNLDKYGLKVFPTECIEKYKSAYAWLKDIK